MKEVAGDRKQVKGYAEFEIFEEAETGNYLLALPTKLFHSLTAGWNVSDWGRERKLKRVPSMDTFSHVVVSFDQKSYPDAKSLRVVLAPSNTKRVAVRPAVAVPRNKGPKPDRTGKLRRSK
jgi:hypothetical protein